MNDNIEKAVKHYSSLFNLPSHNRLMLVLLSICIIAGFVTSETLTGLAYFSVIVLLNFISKETLFRKDPLIKLKRLSALSLFSLTIWVFFIVLGVMLEQLFKLTAIWVKLLLAGLSAAVAVRLMVLSVISFKPKPSIYLISLVEPLSLSLLALKQRADYTSGTLYYSAHAFLYIAAFIIGAELYLKRIDKEGLRVVGLPSIPLFKAFLADWMENLNTPLEDLLEKIGKPKNVKVSIIMFNSKGKPKAAIVVPRIHYGPFKNVGSSALPSLLSTAIEKKFGCVSIVPHSLSGHDLNLTSQKQNERVIEHILSMRQPTKSSALSSLPQKCRVGDAEATCQILGECAFITLTMFPKTMEDLPPELDELINEEAKKESLSCAVVVDAHNSINDALNVKDQLTMLKEAATKAVKVALEHKMRTFEVGSAKVVMEGVGVKEGLGPGGINVLIVRVENKRFAYVLIDGNNMVSGLREDILSSLRDVGVEDGEIMTTDTHVVNGVVLTRRGWHPVGEAIDKGDLILHIKKAVMQALSNTEPVEALWVTDEIPEVKVIGEEQINSLCSSVDVIISKAKILALFTFPILSLLVFSISVFA
ncbi:MAG: DUF2070 family protein [Candidatus Bathyarchaeia archaeon]